MRKARKLSARQIVEKARARAARTIAVLPSKTWSEVNQSWRNALERTRSEDRVVQAAAVEVLEFIENAWSADGPAKSLGWFKWPSLDAPLGEGTLTSIASEETGLLSFLGYRVGNHGAPEPTRLVILDRLLVLDRLPDVFSSAYLSEWGKAGSAARLLKMANCLASWARNNKRMNDSRRDRAVQDWQSDLGYLHDQYYVAQFGFGWPNID